MSEIWTCDKLNAALLQTEIVLLDQYIQVCVSLCHVASQPTL